jgi:hypothetical protein
MLHADVDITNHHQARLTNDVIANPTTVSAKKLGDAQNGNGKISDEKCHNNPPHWPHFPLSFSFATSVE